MTRISALPAVAAQGGNARLALWLASAIAQARGQPVPAPRAGLTAHRRIDRHEAITALADLRKLLGESTAFLAELGAQPSPEGARILGEIAKGAREQARLDRSQAVVYLRMAGDLEAVRARVLSTIKATAEFRDRLASGPDE